MKPETLKRRFSPVLWHGRTAGGGRIPVRRRWLGLEVPLTEGSSGSGTQGSGSWRKTAERVCRPPFGAEDVRRHASSGERREKGGMRASVHDSQSSAVTSSLSSFHLLFQIGRGEMTFDLPHQAAALAGICVTALVENVASDSQICRQMTGVLFWTIQLRRHWPY